MNRKLRQFSIWLTTAFLAVTITACTGTGGNETTTGTAAETGTENATQDSTEETPTSTGATGETGGEVIRIGISQYVEHDALDAAREGFLDKLAELGYREGENLELTIQNAQAEQANAQTIAQNFATMDFDLILAIATPTAQALANLIDDTPILVTAVTDPQDAELVVTNEAPGRNVSGTSDLNPVAEQIDLLTRLVPDVETVAIMYASSEPNSVIQGKMAEAALEAKGLNAVFYTVAVSNDLQSVIESSVGQVDAWYIPTDNMFASSMGIVSQVATDAGIPVIAGEKNAMDAGALATVSLDYYVLGEMTAEMAVEILDEGANPAEMPIRYQDNPQIYVNESFAQAIGLEIPEDILAEAGSGS